MSGPSGPLAATRVLYIRFLTQEGDDGDNHNPLLRATDVPLEAETST